MCYLSEICASGSCGSAEMFWAPDSKRFAFCWGQGRMRQTAIYQLSAAEWKALKTPGDDNDEIMRRLNKVIAAEKKKSHATQDRMLWWKVIPDRWVDAKTLSIYASEVRRDQPKDIVFGKYLFFTLQFDDAGRWKVTKAHELSENENHAFWKPREE